MAGQMCLTCRVLQEGGALPAAAADRRLPHHHPLADCCRGGHRALPARRACQPVACPPAAAARSEPVRCATLPACPCPFRLRCNMARGCSPGAAALRHRAGSVSVPRTTRCSTAQASPGTTSGSTRPRRASTLPCRPPPAHLAAAHCRPRPPTATSGGQAMVRRAPCWRCQVGNTGWSSCLPPSWAKALQLRIRLARP